MNRITAWLDINLSLMLIFAVLMVIAVRQHLAIKVIHFNGSLIEENRKMVEERTRDRYHRTEAIENHRSLQAQIEELKQAVKP